MATSIAKLAILLTTDTSGMARGFNAAQGMVGGFDAKSRLLNGIMTANAAAFAALTTAAVVFAREGIRMASVLERVGIQLEVMTGSARTGQVMLAQMWDFAKETPFSFEEVTRAGKTLMAMGDTAGRAARHLEVLGDVSSGTGQPLNELAQVFGQVQQAGRLTGNELRQFNERGIPLLTELADMLGVSKRAIRDMVEEGEISAGMVEKAFDRMTSAGGRFADMSTRLNDTMSGQWEKLKDSFSMLAFEGAGGSSGWLKQMFEFMNKRNDEITEELKLAKEAPSVWLFHLEQLVRQANPLLKVLPQMFAGEAMQQAVQAARSKMLDAQLAAIGQGMPDQAERDLDRQRISDRIAEEHGDKMKALQKEADKLSQSLRTPGEVMAESMARINELFERGLIMPDIYGRAIEEVKEKFLDASKAKEKFGQTPLGANPAHDIRSSAGISAMNSARSEMQRWLREQETTNKHLSEMKTVMEGVRKNTADKSTNVFPVANF